MAFRPTSSQTSAASFGGSSSGCRPQAVATAGITSLVDAENLSESVGISARAMQRFLTEARWSDETVIGRLQEYLAPRLGHPEAVWVFDGSDFPKQGRKSAGVARQYCGRLGKVAKCHVPGSPLGRALVDHAPPTSSGGGTINGVLEMQSDCRTDGM